MYLIIGQGAAGTAAARRLRELDQNSAITIISSERDSYYSRVDLPEIVAGRLDQQAATLLAADDFAAQRIALRLGERVSRLQPAERMVHLSSGERLSYDRLLLATGSQSVIPNIPGKSARGVYTLWTMADALALQSAASAAERAVVIGAGLIGLKTALALQARGVQTTVVEQQARVLPRQLDEVASELLCAALAVRGIQVRLDDQVAAILPEDGKVVAVQTSGELLPCDLVVLAVGVRPDCALAEAAGLAVARGILVDQQMRTSAPHIFAAGDVAVVTDRITGQPVIPAIWPAAVEQGRLAAESMLGSTTVYAGSMARNSVEIAGLPLVSLGDVWGEYGDEVWQTGSGTRYLRLVSRQGVLRGALMVGKIAAAGVLSGLIERQQPVDIQRLLQGETNYITATAL